MKRICMTLKPVFLSALSFSFCGLLAFGQAANDSIDAATPAQPVAAQDAALQSNPEGDASNSDIEGKKSEPPSAEPAPTSDNKTQPQPPTGEAKPAETAANEGNLAEPVTTDQFAAAAAAAPAGASDAAASSENRGPLTLDHELPAAIQFLARMASINIHFDPSVTFTNVIGPD